MSLHEEEKRSGPRDVQTALEAQRRRAASHGWTLMVLTLILLLVAILFLPQGSQSFGEIQGNSAGFWVKHIRGSAAFTLLVYLASQLFKQAIRFLDWTREKEKEQVRHLLWLRRSTDNPETTMQAIQFIEKGADAKIPETSPQNSRRNSVQRKKSLPASQE